MNFSQIINFITNPIVFFPLVISFLIFRHHKEFILEPKPLSHKQKIIFAVFFGLAFLPAIIITAIAATYIYILNPSDYWYQKAASTVNYHLYQPAVIPSGLIVDTIYQTKQAFADTQNGIKLVLSAPLEDQLGNTPPPLVIINQTQAPLNFDLQDFISQYTQNSSDSAEPVSITTAQNNQGWLTRRLVGKSDACTLTFLTPDQVLVDFRAINTKPEVLFQIANSLK